MAPPVTARAGTEEGPREEATSGGKGKKNKVGENLSPVSPVSNFLPPFVRARVTVTLTCLELFQVLSSEVALD